MTEEVICVKEEDEYKSKEGPLKLSFQISKYQDKPCWLYFENYIQPAGPIFLNLYRQMPDLVKSYYGTVYDRETGLDKSYLSKRLSCLFLHTNKVSQISETNMPKHDWSVCPIVSQIKEHFETKLNTRIDYCLMHLYPDGEVGIGYHMDKEAMNDIVISVSFGATRKFRFRKIADKSGFESELSLKGGDVVIMKDNCQRVLKHSVPIERTVKSPRINLTFRKW